MPFLFAHGGLQIFTQLKKLKEEPAGQTSIKHQHDDDDDQDDQDDDDDDDGDGEDDDKDDVEHGLAGCLLPSSAFSCLASPDSKSMATLYLQISYLQFCICCIFGLYFLIV